MFFGQRPALRVIVLAGIRSRLGSLTPSAGQELDQAIVGGGSSKKALTGAMMRRTAVPRAALPRSASLQSPDIARSVYISARQRCQGAVQPIREVGVRVTLQIAPWYSSRASARRAHAGRRRWKPDQSDLLRNFSAERSMASL